MGNASPGSDRHPHPPPELMEVVVFLFFFLLGVKTDFTPVGDPLKVENPENVAKV